jgi:hypothetical protein
MNSWGGPIICSWGVTAPDGECLECAGRPPRARSSGPIPYVVMHETASTQKMTSDTETGLVRYERINNSLKRIDKL